MKKILSMLLVAAMLISTVIVMAIPVAAVDGDWSVYANKEDWFAEEDEDTRSVAGYKYTDEGLSIVPADWKDWTPYVTAQTTDEVDLRDGLYMQIRVDEFSYNPTNDRALMFHIWDSKGVSSVEPSEEFGHGVATMIRLSEDYDAETGEGGRGIGSIQWFDLRKDGDPFENRVMDKTDEAIGSVEYDEEGRPIHTFEIRWNSSDEAYEAYLNGIAAPANFTIALTDKFANGKAYVSFTAVNSQLGGTAGFTILKFGTSEATATTPAGDDSRPAENTYKDIAEIADPGTVEEGQPAIFMTGDKYDSDLKKAVSGHGTLVNITDEGTIRITSSSSTASLTFNVKNDVSYDIKNFPVVMVLARNFCTCKWEDYDMDGDISEEEMECSCGESVAMYPLMGDLIAPADANKIKNLDVALESYKVYNEETEQNDSFLYFYKDLSLDERFEGRINGARIDFSKVAYTEGSRGTFDICMVGCFRTVADAEAFIEDYIVDNFGELIVDDDPEVPGTDETDPVVPGTDETDPVVPGTDETDPVVPGTDETDDDENTTEKKSEQTTEKKPDSNNNNNKPKDEGGCGSVAGIGAIAVVAIAAAGMVSFRKKED